MEVCRAAIEARDFMATDERHEARIVRVENVGASTCFVDSKTTSTTTNATASQVKSYLANDDFHAQYFLFVGFLLLCF